MGKLLSRTAAAKMLGCNPQTITNYVRYGLIDEVHREMKGRDGFYYDSDQLASLAPHLTEIAELEGRIAGRKEELRQQERELEEARERTRKEFLRLAGGKKTWNKFQELVAGAYAFAGKITPGSKERFRVAVLQGILNLEDFDSICKKLNASPYKVNTAVSEIARRMLKIKNMEERLDEVTRDVDKVFADNKRLLLSCELMEAMQDERVVTSGSSLRNEVEELARKLYPLRKMRISSLSFSTRAESALEALGVRTLFELVGVTEEQLRGCRGTGGKTVDEIKQRLQEMGLSLGMHQLNRRGLGFDYIRMESICDAY